MCFSFVGVFVRDHGLLLFRGRRVLGFDFIKVFLQTGQRVLFGSLICGAKLCLDGVQTGHDFRHVLAGKRTCTVCAFQLVELFRLTAVENPVRDRLAAHIVNKADYRLHRAVRTLVPADVIGYLGAEHNVIDIEI